MEAVLIVAERGMQPRQQPVADAPPAAPGSAAERDCTARAARRGGMDHRSSAGRDNTVDRRDEPARNLGEHKPRSATTPSSPPGAVRERAGGKLLRGAGVESLSPNARPPRFGTEGSELLLRAFAFFRLVARGTAAMPQPSTAFAPLARMLGGLQPPNPLWRRSTRAYSRAARPALRWSTSREQTRVISRERQRVSFGIMPLFALANAGVSISGGALDATSWNVVAAVAVGLVVGKPLGVLLASWLTLRLGIATLPAGVTLRHLVVVGVVAGVGFTMSLFIAQLAFAEARLLAAAKLGVLAASGGAALLGLVLGRVRWTVQRWSFASGSACRAAAARPA